MCNVIVNGKDKDLVESIHMLCSQGSERHRVLSQVMQSLLLASWWSQTQTQLLDKYDSADQNMISGIDERFKSEMRMERQNETCVEKRETSFQKAD
mmetsp:Transcript_9947/g.14944  ORF Transcript_9947/g.14944 Transcript_9947/m.14944 type:complete len:96 (-) Transcript_9947:138-425(-)